MKKRGFYTKNTSDKDDDKQTHQTSTEYWMQFGSEIWGEENRGEERLEKLQEKRGRGERKKKGKEGGRRDRGGRRERGKKMAQNSRDKSRLLSERRRRKGQ